MGSDIFLVKIKNQDKGFPWEELAISNISGPGKSQL